ncbi:MAG: response regulator [Deltaproteobacteria bacterium]|nr:response regulator [Deltaproteobacteria bacterium]
MRQKKILIVEDNEDHRRILMLRLRMLKDVEILEASDGQEALDIVSREPLDLIFMNLGLPVLDGWEVTRRIRAMPSPARDVPIIAHTAYATANDEGKARAAGCDEYLAKPVLDPDLIRQKVERLLTQGRSPQQP